MYWDIPLVLCDITSLNPTLLDQFCVACLVIGCAHSGQLSSLTSLISTVLIVGLEEIASLANVFGRYFDISL